MSTQQNTTSQASQQGVFNPASMAAFNTLVPQFQQALSGYIQQPFSNPFFQTQRQMGTQQAQQQGGTQMSSLLNNLNTQGFGGGANAPWASEMVGNQARSNAGLQSQLGFENPVQNALGMQQFSLGQAGGFKPFQTGQTSTGKQTESTSGLGSWLPQLISSGLGAMTGFGGGGGLLGQLGKGKMAGTGSSNPFFGGSSMYPMGGQLPTGGMNAPASFGGMPAPGAFFGGGGGGFGGGGGMPFFSPNQT